MSLEDYLDDEGDDSDVEEDEDSGPDVDLLHDQWREARLFGV